MRFLRLIISSIAGFIMLFTTALLGQDYLNWSDSQAMKAGKEMTETGSVDGAGWRVNSTNKATSYKYRATWLTPSVIKAAARLEQLRQRLPNAEMQQLLEEAENAAQTVFLIELDAIEGSGVIPEDWQAFLQPEGLPAGAEGCMKGESTPELRKVKGLAGTHAKDYKYDRFWIVFPLVKKDGKPLFAIENKKAELIIRINNNESKVDFTIPSDIREKGLRLSQAVAKGTTE
jgi:hypothetical protein